MRLNAVAVLSRQNACMLGFTCAISDFTKLKTPLRHESQSSGRNWVNKALTVLCTLYAVTQ